MSEGDRLLGDILAEPGDDGLRLVGTIRAGAGDACDAACPLPRPPFL